MPSPQLPNYLIANRKGLALSQDEVAFLLGAQRGTMISRHERYAAVPVLEAALAYEVIYKQAVSELFGGVYQKVEREVAERARTLLGKTAKNSTARSIRKREMLTALANI